MSWWDWLRGKQIMEKVVEIPAPDEVRVRVELPGRVFEPWEVPVRGVMLLVKCKSEETLASMG